MTWLFLLLAGIVLILAGLGFLCFGLVSAAAFGAVPIAMGGTLQEMAQSGAGIFGLFGVGFALVFAAIGLALTVGGAVMTYFGLRIRRRLQAQAQHLVTYGVEAEGTITFLDRNFGVLVNNRPVYSIVEYTFLDSMQRQHTGRVDNLSSDYVIRNKLEVGSPIRIKYLPADPAQSMVLQD